MLIRFLLTLALCLSPIVVGAQTYVGGASGSAFDASPTLTYTSTAGNLLFALVSINDGAATATCTTPTGWTKVHTDDPVYSNYVMCAATKIAAGGGSDAYGWALSGTFSWALGVIEFSGVSSATASTYALADQNDTAPTVSTSDSVASGELVIAGLIDTNEQSLVAPSGYNSLTLSPATGVHYGSNFAAMGGLAWRTSAGGIQTSTWSQADNHFTGVGIYAFPTSGGGGGGAEVKRLLTLGVGQ